MSTQSLKFTALLLFVSIFSFSQTDNPDIEDIWEEEVETILKSGEEIKSVFHNYSVDSGVEIFNLNLKVLKNTLIITSGDFISYEVPIHKIKRASVYKLADDLTYLEIRVKNRSIKRRSTLKNIKDGKIKTLKLRIDDEKTRDRLLSSFNDIALLAIAD